MGYSGGRTAVSGILPPTGSLLVIPNIPPLETRIMVRRTLHGLSGRLLGSALLAGLLALLPVPAWDGPHPMLPVGAIRSSAQGGMDVGILTPSFSNLPLSGPVRTIQAKSDLIVFEQSNYQGRQCLVECPPGSTVTVDITSLPVNFSAGSLAYVRP